MISRQYQQSSGDLWGHSEATGPAVDCFVKPQLQNKFDQLISELVRLVGRGGEGVLVFLPGIGEIGEGRAHKELIIGLGCTLLRHNDLTQDHHLSGFDIILVTTRKIMMLKIRRKE